MKAVISCLLAASMVLPSTSTAVLAAVAPEEDAALENVVGLPADGQQEQQPADKNGGNEDDQPESETSADLSAEAEGQLPDEKPESEELQDETEDASQTEESAEAPAAEQQEEAETDAEPEAKAETEAETESETDAEEQTEEETSEEEGGLEFQPAQAAQSRVELRLMGALPLQADLPLQISLAGEGGSYTASLVLAAGDTQGVSHTFGQLQPGEYLLTIAAPGFEDYTQTIHLEPQQAVMLEAYTGQLSGYDYAAGAHPGAMRIGDVDGDNQVNSDDAALLVDAIDTGSTAVSLDLNGDNEVDLADLQLLAVGLEQSAADSTIQTRSLALPVQSVETVVNGDLEALLDGEGQVSLQPAEGAAISEETPVALQFDFSAGEAESAPLQAVTIQSVPGANEISSGDMEIVYIDENGAEQTMVVSLGAAAARMLRSGPTVTHTEDGALTVDFGGQIAVKKVTIKITGTKNNTNLAEISQVEFLNDTENRIPEPEMNIPTRLSAEAGDKEFTLTWDEQPNVTGYEVEITWNGTTEVRQVAANQLVVDSFKNEKLENNTEYTVRVQSMNGQWRSGYSESIAVRPLASKPPFAPDAVKVEGGYRSLKVTWQKMKDTDSYQVYYRPYGEGEYMLAGQSITGTSFTISDLDEMAKYQVYVVGINGAGASEPSLVAVGQTLSVNPAQMPAYKLINTPGEEGELTSHILNAVRVTTHASNKMVNSPLDEASGSKTALGVVDNDQGSYYQVDDWDDGVMYHVGSAGIRVTFDDVYSFGALSVAEPENGALNTVSVFYKDTETGKMQQLSGIQVDRRTDKNNRRYLYVTLPGEVRTDELLVGFNTGYTRVIKVGEMRFYSYDSISDEIMALYTDAYHTTLDEKVDTDTLDALQARLNTPDPASGELHPNWDTLTRELDYARQLLESGQMDEVQTVKTSITAKADSNYGFTGLNAWQPLGVSANAGEKIVIYVGREGAALGSNTDLRLVATQYHAESGQLSKDLGQLKVGRNEITIPAITTNDTELGGALYIQYTGNAGAKEYGVRVSGGTSIPVLDLYGISDSQQRLEAVESYIAELESFTARLEELHAEQESEYAYDEKNCVLNTTDILLDEMMISVPATQVLNALKGSSAEKAAQLEKSMTAMDQMMTLFYQHKGLNDSAKGSELPSRHLNIRYQRMFGGAFMYAAGDHIGIEWTEVTGLLQGEPVVADEMGRYVSGEWFGWGIGHEIGHNINQGSYAVAEVTNNYFAQLSTAREGSNSVRFGYDAIYKKVTSGTVGRSSDVFTQLGMYWQLHLAYDNYYNFKIFDNYQEQLDNLFYARVDSYARKPASAPAPGGVALSLNGNADQNFMRLASAAAQKDLTEFFTSWGLVPDSTTAAYMGQFEAEERAIAYVNDDARSYRLDNPGTGFAGQAVVSDSSSVSVSKVTPNKVTLQLNNNLEDPSLLLGYEITRVMISEGQEQRQVVGFTTSGTFEDRVTSINNRVIRYEVTAVDQYLNRSAVYAMDPVKISHDGSHDKSTWTVTTNMVSDQDTTPPATDHDPCEPEVESAITQVVDNDEDTTYTGSASGTAWVQLEFHKELATTGLKYTVNSGSAIQDYQIMVSEDGTNWDTVAEGAFSEGENVSTVYFRNEAGDPWVCTYDAAYLKLVVTGQAGQELSISELDVLGPTGDNVDWRTDAEDSEAVGILAEDYVYDAAKGEKIPAGSLVFVGSYKGNPAYNVVLLFDENGNIVGGTDEEGALVASQIILADLPEHGELGETTDGSWIYWIEPNADGSFGDLPETVRAELYRVDNAITNEGQRMVSDSFAIQMPEELGSIHLQ